jgi:NADH-quinone oxidoreductase subunit J
VSVFVVFGALALGAGVGMILQRNAVHAALLLVLNFFAISVLFLSLGAEFLMISQIIVYAGAIMVLFLFVIMLLGVDKAEVLMDPHRFQVRQVFFAVVLAILLVGGLFTTMATVTLTGRFGRAPSGFGGPKAIGQLLFNTYLLPFEVTSLLLLVAAVGILMLAKRSPRVP